VVELGSLDRGWVDATQGHVLALEGGRFGLGVSANVASFGTEEQVKNSLDSVGL
jgi:hypothetical protein